VLVEQDIPLLKLSESSICLKCAIAEVPMVIIGGVHQLRERDDSKSTEAPQDGLAQKRLLLRSARVRRLFDQSLPLSSLRPLII